MTSNNKIVWCKVCLLVERLSRVNLFSGVRVRISPQADFQIFNLPLISMRVCNLGVSFQLHAIMTLVSPHAPRYIPVLLNSRAIKRTKKTEFGIDLGPLGTFLVQLYQTFRTER